MKSSYLQRISCIACHDVQAKCQAKFATGKAVPGWRKHCVALHVLGMLSPVHKLQQNGGKETGTIIYIYICGNDFNTSDTNKDSTHVSNFYLQGATC